MISEYERGYELMPWAKIAAHVLIDSWGQQLLGLEGGNEDMFRRVFLAYFKHSDSKYGTFVKQPKKPSDSSNAQYLTKKDKTLTAVLKSDKCASGVLTNMESDADVAGNFGSTDDFEGWVSAIRERVGKIRSQIGKLQPAECMIVSSGWRGPPSGSGHAIYIVVKRQDDVAEDTSQVYLAPMWALRNLESISREF
jgi:hypothetical protein